MTHPLMLAAAPVIEHDLPRLVRRIEEVKRRRGFAPGLHVILVGEDSASQVYVRNKEQKARALGFVSSVHRLPEHATPETVRALVTDLNRDPEVDGILIQRPLPKHFKEEDVAYWVSPEKDVDAFHPENVGRLWLGLDCFQPCTPSGVIRLLQYYGIPFKGRRACVVGRSSIVGKPMAALLLQQNASVTLAHSQSNDLGALTREAEILVVAAGKPGLIGREHISPGTVVVDVGIHRAADTGKLVGDVRFDEVAPIVQAITPVPGGVGPMTIHELLCNTLFSAERPSRLR